MASVINKTDHFGTQPLSQGATDKHWKVSELIASWDERLYTIHIPKYIYSFIYYIYLFRFILSTLSSHINRNANRNLQIMRVEVAKFHYQISLSYFPKKEPVAR